MTDDEPERLGPWKVSTRAYRYRIDGQRGREWGSWHWHPTSRSLEPRPHLHVAHGPLRNHHLPSGRVGVESVLRLVLTELEAKPLRSDWQIVLDDSEAAFQKWRTWP
jgi:hypothetical protein